MTSLARVATTPIVALDVSTFADARALVSSLGNECDFYKVGLELFSAVGPAVVEWLRGEGKQVFVDLKLHDIPHTVASAARSVATLGASLLTVHASGGAAMVRAAVDGAGGVSQGGGATCGILAVTVLTSFDAGGLASAWGRPPLDIDEEVMRLSSLARGGGASGIVCSGHELATVTAAFGASLPALVPGIRLAGGDVHDQARVMTPRAASRAGARWIILGRAVTAAPDRAAAMAAVRQELSGVQRVLVD